MLSFFSAVSQRNQRRYTKILIPRGKRRKGLFIGQRILRRRNTACFSCLRYTFHLLRKNRHGSRIFRRRNSFCRGNGHEHRYRKAYADTLFPQLSCFFQVHRIPPVFIFSCRVIIKKIFPHFKNIQNFSPKKPPRKYFVPERILFSSMILLI